jgi:hypothetical protein
MSIGKLWSFCQRWATPPIRSARFGPTRRAEPVDATGGHVVPRHQAITAVDATLVAETTHFAIPLLRGGRLPFPASAPPPGDVPASVRAPRDRDTAAGPHPTADTATDDTTRASCGPAPPQAPQSRARGIE